MKFSSSNSKFKIKVYVKANVEASDNDLLFVFERHICISLENVSNDDGQINQ